MAHEGQRGPEILSQLRGASLDLLDDGRLAVPLVDTEGVPQEVDQRMERDGLPERHGLPLDPRRVSANLAPELPEQSGLPDPGLAHDGDDLSPPGPGQLEALLEEPELRVASHERRGRPLDLARAGQPVDGTGRGRQRAARHQLEAPGEERRRLRADDHVSRVGVLGERLQQRTHRPLGVRIDGGPVAMAPDGQLRRVKGQDDGGAAGILGPGALGALLDGHGRGRRVALCVLERLEPEGGDQAGRAHLVHSAAEALHLVDDSREGTVRIRRLRLARSPHDPRPEKGHAAGLPAHAGGWGGDARHR